MPTPAAADVVLDRVYLEVRCRLLDIAASLDRIERSTGSERVSADARLKQLQAGIAILASDGSDRAERIQMLFSDAYTEGWNKKGKTQVNGR